MLLFLRAHHEVALTLSLCLSTVAIRNNEYFWNTWSWTSIAKDVFWGIGASEECHSQMMVKKKYRKGKNFSRSVRMKFWNMKRSVKQWINEFRSVFSSSGYVFQHYSIECLRWRLKRWWRWKRCLSWRRWHWLEHEVAPPMKQYA